MNGVWGPGAGATTSETVSAVCQKGVCLAVGGTLFARGEYRNGVQSRADPDAQCLECGKVEQHVIAKTLCDTIKNRSDVLGVLVERK